MSQGQRARNVIFMKVDSLKEYVNLRESLLKEKTSLEARLERINEALGFGPAPAMAPARKVSPPARKRENKLSLREAVIAATKAKPLTKQEILQAVEKLGYRFNTKNPMNTLNVLLYTHKTTFANEGGKWRAI